MEFEAIDVNLMVFLCNFFLDRFDFSSDFYALDFSFASFLLNFPEVRTPKTSNTIFVN